MMPWENNDYKAAALLIGIIIVAIVIGLYITSQYRAEQDPLKFQENQTATNQPIHGAKLDVQKPIIALSAPGSSPIPENTQPINGLSQAFRIL
jgi:hypothetical protein